MPQTTECALTHRLPSNTTTAARSPADLPPPPVGEGRSEVRLHTANAKSSAVLLPPPWERVGVEAAKKRAATKPHRTSSFTYTPSAQAYVKKTIGCALGRVDNSANEPLSLWERGWGEGSNQLKNRNFGPSTTSPPPSPPLPRCGLRPAGEGGYLNCQHALGRVCNLNFPPLRSGGGAGRGCENRVATASKTKCKQTLGRVCNSNFPPLRSGGGAGRGCENRVATAFKTKYKQPLAHRLPSNTTTAARSPADLPPPPVVEGRGGVSLHTANAKSPAVLHPPPWERVGVGAAKKYAATTPTEHPHLHTPRALKRM